MACNYSQHEEDAEIRMFSEDLHVVSFDHLTTWSVEALKDYC